jgi:hypothetical protein
LQYHPPTLASPTTTSYVQMSCNAPCASRLSNCCFDVSSWIRTEKGSQPLCTVLCCRAAVALVSTAQNRTEHNPPQGQVPPHGTDHRQLQPIRPTDRSSFFFSIIKIKKFIDILRRR